MERSDAEKIARTEAIFREVNERIAESATRLDAEGTAFVCECADPQCTHRVELTLDEYEGIREDGATFVIVPGHEDERVEAVRDETRNHAVIEKRHPLVRTIVLALDPRAVTS